MRARHCALIVGWVLVLTILNAWWKETDQFRHHWDEACYLLTNLDAQELVRQGRVTELYSLSYELRPVVGYVLPIVPLQLLFDISDTTAIILTQSSYLLIALLFIYLLGAAIFTPRVGLVAAVLLSLDPEVLSLSRTYWPHLATLSFAALTTWLLLQSNFGERRRYLLAASVALGIGMMTRPIFPVLFALGPMVVVVIGAFRRNRRLDETLLVLACVTVPAAVICLPYHWGNIRAMLGWIQVMGKQYSPVKEPYSIQGLLWYAGTLYRSAGVPLMCLSYVGLVGTIVLRRRRQFPIETWYPLSWLASGYICLSLVATKDTYYAVALHGPLILCGVAVLDHLLPRRREFWAMAAILGLALGVVDAAASVRPLPRWASGRVRAPLPDDEGVTAVVTAVAKYGASTAVVVGRRWNFNPVALLYRARRLGLSTYYYADSVPYKGIIQVDAIIWTKGEYHNPEHALNLGNPQHKIHRMYELVETVRLPKDMEAKIYLKRPAAR